VLKEDLGDEEWRKVLPTVVKDIFKLARSLGGTISAEHGVGLTKKKYLPISRETLQIEIMKKVKNIFDPNHILNPGKIFDLK
jgi:glycolate oxidase